MLGHLLHSKAATIAQHDLHPSFPGQNVATETLPIGGLGCDGENSLGHFQRLSDGCPSVAFFRFRCSKNPFESPPESIEVKRAVSIWWTEIRIGQFI